MAEGLLRPPSSLSLLLMERANLANETRVLKRPLMRGTNREESVYVRRGHCALSGTPSCFYGHFSHRSCWRSTINQRALAGPSKDTAIKWKVPTLQVTLSFDTSHSAGNYFIPFFPFLNMILFSAGAPLVLKSIPVLWQSVAFLTNWSGLLALSSWPISFPCCHSSSTLFAFQWPLCLPLYCLILCPPCMNSNSMSASAVLLWNSPRKRWNMK